MAKRGEGQLDRACEKLRSITKSEEETNILQIIKARKANCFGHTLRRNCPLRHVVEGKLEARIEVKERRGRRRNKLLNHLKETRG
jgi:hypothetical protein